MHKKLTEWSIELKILTEFAKSQSKTAYAVFWLGKHNKLSYFLQTIPEMNDLKKLVDDIVQNFLLPTFIGKTISEEKRELY